MSECRRIRKRLVDYLEDELPVQAKMEAAAHLERCQACRREMDALRNGKEALLSLARTECPDDIWARIESRILGVEREGSRIWRLLSRPAYALLTSVALFALLGLSISMRPTGIAPPTMWLMVSPISPVGVQVEAYR